MRWARHVSCMEARDVHTIFWLENLKGNDHSQDLGVDGKMIFEKILGK
jgi:hypothetical protein